MQQTGPGADDPGRTLLMNTTTPAATTSGPLALVTGALLAIGLAAATLFAVGFDQGQLTGVVASGADSLLVHEVFHDARHMLGFPCH